MNPDDPFRELTPEEAELAYEAAEAVPMTPEEIDAIVRYVMVADGRVPIGEMSAEEVECHLRAVAGRATPGTGS